MVYSHQWFAGHCSGQRRIEKWWNGATFLPDGLGRYSLVASEGSRLQESAMDGLRRQRYNVHVPGATFSDAVGQRTVRLGHHWHFER
jgi:hypothetical protein